MNSGDKFGKLTLLTNPYSKEGYGYNKFVRVQCECGVQKELQIKSFQGKKKTQSCGCSRKGLNSVSRTEVCVGEVFGELTIISKVEPHEKGRTKVIVDCSCGNKGLVKTFESIKTGNTLSCGCLQRKRASEAARKHNLSKTQTYSHWNHMIQRCKEHNEIEYPRHAGRGISVCLRWLEPDGRGFLNFLEDMGEVPNGLSLDRIDTNGNYEPSNCRWADLSVQQHNQNKLEGRSSMFIGVTQRKDTLKWLSHLQYKGKKVFRKEFNTELEAAIAYDEESYKVYGDKPNELKIKQRLNKDIYNGSS